MKQITKITEGHLKKELPDTIYLQLHGDNEHVDNDEKIDFGDVTWSEDRMYPTDVEYKKVKDRIHEPNNANLPWISVEVKLPKTDDNVICCNNRSGFIGIANYYNYTGKWEEAYSTNEIRGITHWMPIPSFDDILEANKDVLERIKEKGD